MTPGVRLLLLCIGLWLPLATGAASAPVVLGGDMQSVRLNGLLSWWPEAPATTALQDARAADAAFVPAPALASFGPRPRPLWFRVALRNDATTARDFLLEIGFANLDEVDVYQLTADSVRAGWQTGVQRPAARPWPSTRFVFPLRLAAGETTTLYLRVASGTVINLPLTLYEERAWAAHAANVRLWQGLFYGLVLGTLLCAAFLWRTTGDDTFRNYAVAVLLALGYFLGMDGQIDAWFPQWPWLQERALFFGATLSVSFTLWFAGSFLDTARRVPRVDRWLRRVALAGLAAAALVLVVPLLGAMLLSMLFSVAMAALILAAGIGAWRTGYAPARLLVVAIGVHLFSISLLSFSALVESPGLFSFADGFHRVGFVFNLVCFTLALGERIRLRERDRRAAEENVLQASADSRARTEFMSRMSHELRTPMTGVLGMAELLDHTDLDTRQRRYLSTLRYSGEILLNLINDLLDHARLESGRVQVKREAFDLLRVIDECRMLFAQLPNDGHANSGLHIDMAAGASRIVVGDGARLRQILVNMLLRAFRTAGGGSVEFRVGALAAGWLRFEIEAATGAGDQGAVADGLGLATSARLAQLMGGQLVVQSTPGAGTLYRLDLPLFAAG